MPVWSQHLGLDDAEAEKVEKRGRYIAVKTLIGAVVYPLTHVKILFQLGYEPFPLAPGKFLWFFREAYFLPNGFKYAKKLYDRHGLRKLYAGIDASMVSQFSSGLIDVTTSVLKIFTVEISLQYMDRHYPEIGGKPINLDKEESEMSDAESARRVLRFAIRESISRTVAVITSRPFTVIMIRQIAQIVGGELKYHNVLSSLRLIGIEEGPKGLFSGVIPQLIAEYMSIWGIQFIVYGIERITLRAQQDAIRSNNKEEENFVVSTRKMLHLIAPVFVNSFTYPFQVVSTVMAVTGSGLLVSMLPYSPPFSLWQDAYDYLLPVNGLKRGSRIFWREHCGAVSVGPDHELYAANKHFVMLAVEAPLRSDECLTAVSVRATNSFEKLHDDSMLSMTSAIGVTHESIDNSNIKSITNLSTKMSSLPTCSTNDETEEKQHYSVIEGSDLAEIDDYDIFANKLITRMIDNLRAKHLNEGPVISIFNEFNKVFIREYDARVILMRRGETVSEVFPNWTMNAFNDSHLYMPFDLNMPYNLREREKNDDFLIDPPLTNISAHFAAQLAFTMTNNNLPTIIYSGPEMAVIQTAREFIDGAEIGINWLIEPGLVRYFSSDEPKPTFVAQLQQETVYTMEAINNIIGKETAAEFENRIEKVISRLKFPRKASTVLIAEDCVINAIIQKFIRNGKKLTRKQQLTITKRIPRLSLIHFDIDSSGRWKPSSASLPGLQGNTPSMFNLPDVNFLIRPAQDF
uniref:Uncharacterized protein n=1 Tax=Setaria digitata TaxID=48799 RepID=A0A915PWI5_9BILA